MIRKLTPFLFFLLTVSLAGQSQTRQSSYFKKIRFAGYEVTGEGRQNLYFYSEIDASGKFTIRMDFLPVSKTVSVILPDSTFNLLNSVFSGKEKLSAHLVPKELENGVHYSGTSYRYIQFTGMDGRSDELSFIRYILDDRFRKLVIELENTLDQEELPEIKTTIRPDEKFTKALTRDYQESAYLPKFKLPPPAAE